MEQRDRTFFEYCCKDSCVTYEISEHLDNKLKGASLEHYRLNIALLNPLLDMEMRGIRYDIEGAASRRALLQTKMYEAQARLNALTGYCFDWKSLAAIRQHATELMSKKKGGILKPYIEAAERLNNLVTMPNPSLASIGEIEDLLDKSLNVGSTSFRDYLYTTLQLPPQYNEDEKKNQVLTADYEALLKLSKHLSEQKESIAYQVIQLAIQIRALQTRQGMLAIAADSDGRIRCGYNIVGSETGRITCYTSPTGSGYNLQTIPNYDHVDDAPGGVLGDRDLFLADEGYWLFQCDLSGADGWTVAAYSAMLGDRTLLDDLQAGLKPAKILALKLRDYKVNFDERESLKAVMHIIKKEDWDYFACKRVYHGADYLEGDITISRNILKDSEGKLFMPPKECKPLKEFFFQRYRGVKLYHNWIATQLRSRAVPSLTAASGQTRRFFDRADNILPKAVAFEPQAVTTYATNLAMYNLWTDKENRSGTKLTIQPLHTIHDALMGQFPKEYTKWAVKRIKGYFNNTIHIAGQPIVIPYEGNYGSSWGNLKEGTI